MPNHLSLGLLDLPNDWQVVEFGSVIDGRTRNGIYKQKQFRGSGRKMVNMGELFAYPRLRDVPMSRIQLTHSEDERFGLQAGDLLFARRSLIAEGAGKCSIVCEVKEPLTFESSIIRARPNPKIADSMYLYYMFNSPVGAYLLGTILRQVAVSGITGSDLVQLQIPLPPLPEQTAIADVLGYLDDKIELNYRMNATLESMARAVFRQWFVESEEAKGWEVKTVGDVVSVVGGSTPSTTNSAFWENGDIHWVTPKDLSPLQSPILLDTNSLITELGLQQISSGLLPVGTVLLSSRAPIGYLAISQIPVAINQGFIAIKCTEEIPNYYMLHWLKENMDAIVGRANGTTFLEISKSNFRPMPIVVPPADKVKMFGELVEPMYQKIVANLKESRTLTALRDALLPRLMSGEVRVKDIEKIL